MAESEHTQLRKVWCLFSLIKMKSQCIRTSLAKSGVGKSPWHKQIWSGEKALCRVFNVQIVGAQLFILWLIFPVTKCQLGHVLLINIQCHNRISGCLVAMPSGVRRDAHIHSKTIYATVTRSSHSWVRLYTRYLAFWSAATNQPMIYYFVCKWRGFFFPPSHPDGCFLKQSAGPSGVFSISPAVCHAGRRVVNLAGVRAWLWFVAWKLRSLLTWRFEGLGGAGEVVGRECKKGTGGERDQVNSSRVTLHWGWFHRGRQGRKRSRTTEIRKTEGTQI